MTNTVEAKNEKVTNKNYKNYKTENELHKKIRYDKTLTCNSRIVLQIMVDYSNRPGWQMRHYHLEKESGLSPYLLSNAIENLLERGYLTRTRKKYKGQWAGYDYQFNASHPLFKNSLPDKNLRAGDFGPKNFNYTMPYTDGSSLTDIKGNEETGENVQSLAMEKAVPSYTKKEEQKKKDFLKGFKKQASRQKPLTEEQLGIVAWLQLQNIGASYDSLTYWACNYSIEKIKDAVFAMENERNKGTFIKNPPGFIRNCLDGKMVPVTEKSEKNKAYAKKLLAKFGFTDWTFHNKYFIDESLHKEIPFTIDSWDFERTLQNLVCLKSSPSYDPGLAHV